MQSTLALLLTVALAAFPLGVVPQPDAPQPYVVSQPELLPEPIEELVQEEPSVDGLQWEETFADIWGIDHDIPVDFQAPEERTEWSDAYNLAFGFVQDMLTVEMYQLHGVPDEYCVEINLFRNNLPRLQRDQYFALFYDAIAAAIMTDHDSATDGEINATLNGIYEELELLLAEDAETTYASYSQDDRLYVSLQYDVEERVVTCTLSYTL